MVTLEMLRPDRRPAGYPSLDNIVRFAALAVELRRMAIIRLNEEAHNRQRLDALQWIEEMATCRLQGPRCIGHTAAIEALAKDCDGPVWVGGRNPTHIERMGQRFAGLDISAFIVGTEKLPPTNSPGLVIVDNSQHVVPYISKLRLQLSSLTLPPNFILFLMQ